MLADNTWFIAESKVKPVLLTLLSHLFSFSALSSCFTSCKRNKLVLTQTVKPATERKLRKICGSYIWAFFNSAACSLNCLSIEAQFSHLFRGCHCYLVNLVKKVFCHMGVYILDRQVVIY